MSEQVGTMLVQLRQNKGYTQLRVAEGLFAASGVATVTRQEVSLWERRKGIPSGFWLRWLAVVLEVGVEELEGAEAADSARQVNRDIHAHLRRRMTALIIEHGVGQEGNQA